MAGKKPSDPTRRGIPALAASDRNVMLAVRVPEDLRVRARKYGVDQRTNLQEVVIAALDEYLRKRGA